MEINATFFSIAIPSGIALTIATKFIWSKWYSPTLKSKTGNTNISQSSQEGQNIANNQPGSGNIANYGNMTIHAPVSQKKVISPFELDELREALELAVRHFFFPFIGRDGRSGYLNPPHLEGPRTIKSHVKRGAHSAFDNADKKMALIFREYGNKLSAEQQSALGNLRLKLIAIWRQDPFDITEALRTETLAEIARILATEKP